MCGSLLCFVQLISSLSAGQIKFFRNCENDRKGDPDFGSGVLPHLLCAILRLKDPTITVPKKITEGLTHKLFLDQLEAKVKDLRQSTSLIAKEGATRLIYAVYTLAAFVLRGCELMVGLISLLGVASTIGSSSRVNDFTMSHLSGAGMLEDILYGLGKIINPKNYLAEGSNRDENDFLLI